MVDIEKLKEICGDEALSETTSRYITTSEYREAFEAFVEEVSPAAVLELIAENERFKAERDQLRAEVERRARNEIRLGDLYSTTEKHLIASGIENDRLREEVEALRAVVDLLSMLRGMINCTPENDELKSGAWISTKHPTIQRIDALLAAMTAKEEV